MGAVRLSLFGFFVRRGAGAGRRLRRGVLAVVGLALLGAAPAAAAPFVYVTNAQLNNLAQFDAPPSSFGALTPLKPATVVTGRQPGGMTISPNGKNAYVTNSFDETTSQYSIDPFTGVLTPLTPASVASGNFPLAVVISPNGKNAYVANLGDSTVSQYSVNPSTGALTPLSPATVATGLNPKGVAISPNGKNLYVPNSVANSLVGTVSQYSIDPSTGTLTPLSPATVSAGYVPDAVAVSPDGKSAYVPSFYDAAVWQYSIDPTTGALSPMSPATVPAGNAPGAVAFSPDGSSAYVTNADDDTVSQYSVDPSTGALTPLSPATVATGNNPTDVIVSPDGKSGYVANGSTVSQYKLDPTTGMLSPMSPPRVPTGTNAYAAGLAVTPDADLTAVVSAPASVTSGSQLSYTIKVANAGPSAAWQDTFKDVLPAGTQFVSMSPTHGLCTAPMTGTSGGTVTCQLAIAKPGQSAQFRIVVTVTATPGQTITDGAGVRSVTPDPLLTNNQIQAQTNVTN